MTELQIMMGLMQKAVEANAMLRRALMDGQVTHYEAVMESAQTRAAVLSAMQIVDMSYTERDAERLLDKYTKMSKAAEGDDGKCA